MQPEPILKTLAVFLGLVATAIFVLPLVFNSSFLPFCGILAGILGGTAISIGIKAESIAKDILALKNPEWSALIEILRAEKTKIMKKSQQHEDARALYLNEPAKILQQFEKGGRDSYEYWEWVDNPKYKTLEQDYQSWKRADLLYQERMLLEFDQKAREKIAGLLNTPSK